MNTQPLFLSQVIFYVMMVGVVIYFLSPVLEMALCWLQMRRATRKVVLDVERIFKNHVVKEFVVEMRSSSFTLKGVNGEEHSFYFYADLISRRSLQEQVSMKVGAFQATLVAMDLKEREFVSLVETLRSVQEAYGTYLLNWKLIFKDSKCVVIQ